MLRGRSKRRPYGTRTLPFANRNIRTHADEPHSIADWIDVVTAHVRAGSSSPKAKTRVSSVPPAIERAVAEGAFDVDRFVESFEVLVEAAGGVSKLQQLVL